MRRILVWHIPPPVHSLMDIPDSAASPSQHVWHVQQVKLLKLPVTLSPQNYAGILLPIFMIFWLQSLFPSLTWRTLKHILAKFSHEALNDCQQNLSLLITEMFLIKKPILQNRMALDIIECFMSIPDESVNVSSLLNHIKIQVDSFSD